jgi:hypothetical protein
MSRVGKIARLPEQIFEQIIRRRHGAMPDKGGKRIRKNRNNRKIGFCPFFDWNPLRSNLFQPKMAAGILRILRKNYAWMYGGRGRKKGRIMGAELRSMDEFAPSRTARCGNRAPPVALRLMPLATLRLIPVPKIKLRRSQSQSVAVILVIKSPCQLLGSFPILRQ